MKRLIPLILILFSISGNAQDSLILENANIIAGEIKSMDRGILTIETDYSDVDMKIKWSGVSQIFTTTNFLVTLTDGSRVGGVVNSIADNQVVITSGSDSTKSQLSDIVLLKLVNEGFRDQISASVSVGYSVTRAQNLRQFSTRSNIGYVAKKWSGDVSYNGINSTQDEVEDIQRKDGGLTFNYFLPNDWFIPISSTFLSNTEQKIDLRLLGKLGIGKYVIHENRLYWAFSTGANFNLENFSDETSNRRSWEGFLGTELNLFDMGDLTLLIKAVGYPSITERGRIRADFNFDTKYDLPLDFFVQLGVTVNYDNKPVEGAPETDYVFQTTFGWKW